MQGIFSAITDFFGLIYDFFRLIFTIIKLPFRIFEDIKDFAFRMLYDFDMVPWIIGVFIVLNILVGIIAKIAGRNFSDG